MILNEPKEQTLIHTSKKYYLPSFLVIHDFLENHKAFLRRLCELVLLTIALC